ncbi:MAG: Uma2 family endonuclease, partial [Gammaproteobacteria bacterium]|nr:Uma2 family endonuclease [Gammaproteobacteria bacterium]
STAAHDQTVKLAAYERHGVKEYWLVHPADRIVTVYSWANGGYSRPAISEFEGTLTSNAVPMISIDWARIVARLPENPP